MKEDGPYLPTKSSFLQLILCHWMSSEDTEGDRDGLKFRDPLFSTYLKHESQHLNVSCIVNSDKGIVTVVILVFYILI